MKSCILFCLALKASISSSSVSLVHTVLQDAGQIWRHLQLETLGGKSFPVWDIPSWCHNLPPKLGYMLRVDNWWPRIGFLQLPRHQRQESVEVNARSIVLTIPTNPLLKFLLRGVLSKRAQQSTEFLAPRPPR